MYHALKKAYILSISPNPQIRDTYLLFEQFLVSVITWHKDQRPKLGMKWQKKNQSVTTTILPILALKNVWSMTTGLNQKLLNAHFSVLPIPAALSSFFFLLKVPKSKAGPWYCRQCQCKTSDDQKIHESFYHDKKQFSFVCPCGYGSLIEAEMCEHFRVMHQTVVEIRSPTFRPYWWTGLPSFKDFKKCPKCDLQTPLERLCSSHKCVNYSFSRPIPKTLEWQQFVGRNHRPYRPFGRPEKTSIETNVQDRAGAQASKKSDIYPTSASDGQGKPAFPRFAKPSFTPASKPHATSHSKEFQEPDMQLIKRYRFERRLVVDDYSHFAKFTLKDGKKIQQRGFLEGKLVDYNAIAMTEKVLLCGHYVVTDCNAQILADVFVSPHFSCQMFASDDDVLGYNPAKFPIVGDMVNLTTTPHMMTHHLALSNILKAGEYRITRKTQDSAHFVMKFWLENGRRNVNSD